MSPPIEEKQLLEGLSIVHLKVLGLWNAINTYRTTGRRTLGLNILTTYSVSLGGLYTGLNFMAIFFIALDVKNLTSIFLNVIPCMQAVVKSAVFWLRVKDQCEIFSLLKQNFLTCLPRHKMPHIKEIYRQSAKRSNISCVAAFMGIVSCLVTWISFPGFVVEDWNGGKAVKITGSWYPLPFSRSPWYEIMYYYEVMLLISHALLLSFYMCVMVQPLVCLSAHFKVLGYHISTLKAEDVVHSQTDDSSRFLNEQLRAIMSDYEVLLRYTAIIQDVQNWFVTVILGSGIVVLIMGTLQMIFVRDCEESKDTMYVFLMLTFLSYEATEVLLICVSSSELETASYELRFALYSSDWYLADDKYTIATQMMMIRTTKPLTLVALKVYPVNLEIVLGIFQFTYTAAMVLSETKD